MFIPYNNRWENWDADRVTLVLSPKNVPEKGVKNRLIQLNRCICTVERGITSIAMISSTPSHIHNDELL